MKIISLSEGFDALREHSHKAKDPALDARLAEIHARGLDLCNMLGATIAHICGAGAVESSWEADWEGGLAFGCFPLRKDDPVPEMLAEIDTGADWEPRISGYSALLEPIPLVEPCLSSAT
jgi:hypothetical protein